MLEFKAWPKIPRGGPEEITITEKIDGTNACIAFDENGDFIVQSRKRIITPQADNYGFAGWCHRNIEDLRELGKGYHYGEWAGPGIQGNRHGLETKMFCLFNVSRPEESLPDNAQVCNVPVLYEGPYEEGCIRQAMTELLIDEVDPEGIVIWYHRSRRYEKVTYAYKNGKWGEK